MAINEETAKRRARLSAISDMFESLEWRYFTEELEQAVEEYKESFIGVREPYDSGYLSGKIEQARSIIFMPDLVDNAIRAMDDEEDREYRPYEDT